MAGSETLTIERTSWGPFVNSRLANITGQSAPDRREWRNWICQGIFSALLISIDEIPVGVCLYSVVDGVLIVEGAAGKSHRHDLSAAVIPALMELGRFGGARALRFETARTGLVRKSEAMGFEQIGWKMEIAL